jgi:hypothetical protein
MNINTQSFIRVSQIIERDSKDTTYKFALLRATIDAINLYDQHIIKYDDKVVIPTGLLIEQWLWYYYPLMDSKIFLPQKNGEPAEMSKGKNISFRKHFRSVIDEYSKNGNFKLFYNDYKRKKLKENVNRELYFLINDLYQTITKMPMKYIGKSVSKDEYSIYSIEKNKNRTSNDAIVCTEFLLNNYGSFSIPGDFYLVLKYLGGFIGGKNTIINNWADFIVKNGERHNSKISKELVLNRLMTLPNSERDIATIEKYYKNQNDLYCVWSGARITTSTLNIDHVLPFAHYLNNDLWNLLPTVNKVNGNKSDKIPSPILIDKRKDIIIDYWENLHDYFTIGFEDEIKISLHPEINFHNSSSWQNLAIDALKEKAEFLINIKGIEPWER